MYHIDIDTVTRYRYCHLKVIGAVPLDVQSLDLDEKVPQWSAKQKSSKSNAVKYVVRGKIPL